MFRYRTEGLETLPLDPQRAAATEVEIARLRELDLAVLQARWHSLRGRRAPRHLPRHLLLRNLVCQLQAAAHGDLVPATRCYLDQVAEVTAKFKGDLVTLPMQVRRLCNPARRWCGSGPTECVASWHWRTASRGTALPTAACPRLPAPLPAPSGTAAASSVFEPRSLNPRNVRSGQERGGPMAAECRLHPGLDRPRSGAGVQLARCPARGRESIHQESGARGLDPVGREL